MLILTARPGQDSDVIKIGNDIEIRIVSVRDQQASIGISAPQDVRIVRNGAINKQPRNRDDDNRGNW